MVAVEADPRKSVVQNETRSHYFFCEIEGADTMVLEVSEIEATLLEFAD